MKKDSILLDDIADYEGSLIWMTYYYEDQLNQKTIDMMANDAAAIEAMIAHFFFDNDPQAAREYVVVRILSAGIVDDAPDEVKEVFDQFQMDVIETAMDDHLNIDPFIEDYRPEDLNALKEPPRIPGFGRNMGRRWRR